MKLSSKNEDYEFRNKLSFMAVVFGTGYTFTRSDGIQDASRIEEGCPARRPGLKDHSRSSFQQFRMSCVSCLTTSSLAMTCSMALEIWTSVDCGDVPP